MTARILASAIVEIVGEAFRRNEAALHKCFRIKNLQAEEIVAFVSKWQAQSTSLGLSAVQVVVADDLGGQVPAECVAREGLSITYYRNHNQGGLVYLETKVQSDEQGLQNLFTIRDSNFLDGSFDEYAGAALTVPRLLLQKAWEEAATGRATPTLLLDRASLVLSLVHPDITAVPVRRFIAFAAAVCVKWANWGSPVDSISADVIVGECLSQLDMFPDARWRHGEGEPRIKRRLELNARHAEMIASGSEIDADDLCECVARTSFVDSDGAPLPAAEQQRYENLCTEYARNPSEQWRLQIPYTVFEQLFKRDTLGLKLGERVRAEIELSRPERLVEFDAADVMSGLNSQLQSEAERLLEITGERGESPLADLLSPRTRRIVERIATPPKRRFFNPAIEIVRLFLQLKSQDPALRPARIELYLSTSVDPLNVSLGLFAFLFGPTLLQIAEAINGLPGACELQLAPELITQQDVPPLDVDRVEDDEYELARWLPLEIGIRITAAGGEVLEELDKVEWYPEPISYFAMMWLLVADTCSPVWDAIGELVIGDAGGLGDWTLPFIQRLLPLTAIAHRTSAGIPQSDIVITDLLSLRCELRDGLRGEGLSIERINSFLDGWKSILERARLEYVPDGSRPDGLNNLLCNDTIFFPETGRRLMLPIQPLRLRWIASYLERCVRLTTNCLEGQAGFATGDGEKYLDWLEELTPHESPPTSSGAAGEILFARTELGWFEEFAALSRVASDVSVDIHALASIAARVTSYLEAHPHKCDGLALLLVLPTSDEIPAELVRQVARGRLAGLRVSLTVAVPKSRWEQIAKTLAAVPGEERGAASGRLFPAHDLAFLDYSVGDDLAALVEGKLFDIALVTHVMQENVQIQQNTEPPVERTGAFNPLVDRPVRLESSGGGGSISIVMLPRDQDFLLETWGTLVVRSNRSRPISPSQPENTDFVELRVSFQDAAGIFNVLHKSSHWVITLERHITRQQIESIEAGEPDILSVETGIGGNGLSTIIVSSRSGRALIERRLGRKLCKLAPPGMEAHIASEISQNLARRIYDETRQISPHLALQAMGVARVMEEILGLCVARRVADQQVPARLRDGLSAWISLDEHSDWFGGKSQVRADMCRINFERSESGLLEISVLILEGKFRQAYDAHGVTQVNRTCEFFRSILACATADAPENIDASMWRARLLAAIENVSPEARTVTEIPGNGNNGARGSIPVDIRQMFSEGKYVLKVVEGLYSVTLWESLESEILCNEVDGVQVVRSGREHLLALITRAAAEQASRIEPVVSANSNDVADEGPSALKPMLEKENAQADVAQGIIEHRKAGPLASVDAAAAELTAILALKDLSPASLSVAREKMNRAELRHMYDEILGCFASHNISVFAAPDQDAFIEGPASILFKVKPGSGVDPKKLFEKTQALKLKLEMEQDQNIMFNIDMGFVTIDVPKRMEHRYFVNASHMWDRWNPPSNALSVPIGEDSAGQLVALNFSSPNSPHLLVAGTTGSGKSEALNTILFGLVRYFNPSQLKLLLVDPKGTELLAFDKSAYLMGDIGWDDIDALNLIKQAVEEMQRRYALFRDRKTKSLADFNSSVAEADKLPWWLVVLDEYADLTHEPQVKKDIEQELKRLAQKARAAGIHVIIATQKPSAEVISTNLRSNLPSQLSLRVKSGTESRVVLDEAGAENLNGKGDALFKSDGKLIRVQCARVEPQDQVVDLVAKE